MIAERRDESALRSCAAGYLLICTKWRTGTTASAIIPNSFYCIIKIASITNYPMRCGAGLSLLMPIDVPYELKKSLLYNFVSLLSAVTNEPFPQSTCLLGFSISVSGWNPETELGSSYCKSIFINIQLEHSFFH